VAEDAVVLSMNRLTGGDRTRSELLQEVKSTANYRKPRRTSRRICPSRASCMHGIGERLLPLPRHHTCVESGPLSMPRRWMQSGGHSPLQMLWLEAAVQLLAVAGRRRPAAADGPRLREGLLVLACPACRVGPHSARIRRRVVVLLMRTRTATSKRGGVPVAGGEAA